MGPILCGVDFSEHSRRALALSRRLADRLHAPLIVLSAVDPLLAEAADLKFEPGRLVKDAERDLAAFVESTGRPSSPTKIRVVVGPAAPVLLSQAGEERASMLAVGTHGLGWMKRMWFGSTTLRLLRAAEVPVLAVPRLDEDAATPEAHAGALGFARLLCGVDFGVVSTAAARAAAALASRLSLPVTLVHAVAPIPVPDPWAGLAAEATARAVENARRRMREVAASAGIAESSTDVLIGEPADVLVAKASADGGALVVLGLGAADPRTRPGATASRVLSQARTPVLAVP